MTAIEMKEIELNVNEMEDVAGGAAQQYIIYIVQRGDNLTKIAHAFNVTVNQLVRRNKIKDPNFIRTGQSLKIYIG